MIALMISIKPKWYAKIMNGEKTIEFRTSKALANAIQKLIDKYGYADIYAYCSKQSPWIFWDKAVAKINNGKGCVRGYKSLRNDNGKVLFKFRCYKVEEIDVRLGHPKIYIGACVGDLWCLENHYHDKDYIVRAIHISDLEIFDKPKELSEFKHWVKYQWETIVNGCEIKSVLAPLQKAPQNFTYVEVE